MIIEKRILDFEKLGLGMFVHFGPYSILGKGEWALRSLGLEPIPKYNFSCGHSAWLQDWSPGNMKLWPGPSVPNPTGRKSW